MQGWLQKKIVELAEFINGYAFKPEDWGKEGLPIIRIEQLKNPEAITDYYAGKLPNKNIIDDGDLIFSWSASLFLKIWQHGTSALNQHLFKVIEKDKVDRHFLKFLIEYYLPEFTKASHGSTMQHITRKELAKFQVLVPSIKEEQAQIATILSTIDRAIEQTEAIIAKHQRIKTGLMQDLLTRGIDEHGNIRSEETHQFKDSSLGKIPVEWEIKTLSSLTSLIIDGTHFTPTYMEFGVPFLRVTDINTDKIKFHDIKYISKKEHERLTKRCKPEFGDILYSKNGTIGIPKVVNWNWEFSIFVSLALLKLRKDLVFPRFIELILASKVVWDQIMMRSKQGTVINLHLEEIREFIVPVPLREEQERLSELVDSVDNAIQVNYEKLSKLQSVKQGLMQDLLTGKVRVTDLLNQQLDH